MENIEDIYEKGVSKPKREATLFAAALTFSMFSVFLFPIITCWALAFDTTVAFWFGRYTFWWTLPIPLVLMIMIGIQASAPRPRKNSLIFMWVLPSVIIFVLGGIMNTQATHLIDRLLSKDCKVFPSTRPIMLAYQQAEAHLEECLGNVTHPIHRRTLLQACPKYEEWHHQQEDPAIWDYLAFVQMNYDCTGFCQPREEGVWSVADSGSSSDACTKTIVRVLQAKVVRLTYQLMLTASIIIGGSVLWMSVMWPRCRAYFNVDGGAESDRLSKLGQENYGAARPPLDAAPMPPPISREDSVQRMPPGMPPGMPPPMPPTAMPGHFPTLPPTAPRMASSPPGQLPPGAMLPGGPHPFPRTASFPPGSLPPGQLPPGVMLPGGPHPFPRTASFPPGSLPPGAMVPGGFAPAPGGPHTLPRTPSFPPGSLPPGAMVPGGFAPAPMGPGPTLPRTASFPPVYQH